MIPLSMSLFIRKGQYQRPHFFALSFNSLMNSLTGKIIQKTKTANPIAQIIQVSQSKRITTPNQKIALKGHWQNRPPWSQLKARLQSCPNPDLPARY